MMISTKGRYALRLMVDLAEHQQENYIPLKEIAQRDGISCTCGSHSWTFQVNYSSVDLICKECGAQMRIPAGTADDIDDICCKTRLLIRGKENQ